MTCRAFPALAAIAVLAACQPGERQDRSPTTQAAPAPASNTPAPAPAPAASPAKGGDLAAYVGKYPFDKVDGVSWTDNPTVQAAITRTVTDPAVRKAIVGVDGTAGPIAAVDGRIAAWVCEPHNCGPHNWSVLIDPASGAADVCYFNEATSADNARWFLAGGKQETRPGDCAIE